MAKDNSDLLDVLKSELRFLENGGYRSCLVKSWRPQLAFIESRTCSKYRREPSGSCIGCVLMQFVPPERRKEKTPCWNIPLNEEGQTVDSFYQWGTHDELESALRNWLWSAVLWVEDERRADQLSRRNRGGSAAHLATIPGNETRGKGEPS